ncbi:MAG: hypothetical protein AAGA53_17255 [Pseudomonadota bacterium]
MVYASLLKRLPFIVAACSGIALMVIVIVPLQPEDHRPFGYGTLHLICVFSSVKTWAFAWIEYRATSKNDPFKARRYGFLFASTISFLIVATAAFLIHPIASGELELGLAIVSLGCVTLLDLSWSIRISNLRTNAMPK